jgi:NAD(P)H-hydrate epimerase
MIALTAAQMREADRRCIEELGIPGAVLMDNAGAAVFREITGGPVGIVCGKGNNGGDGFVAARFALLAGLEPTVVLAAEPAQITGDAKTFMSVYLRLGGNMVVAPEAKTAAQAVAEFAHCAVLVDALLGTGISGEVRGTPRAVIEAWPRGPVTIAVDLPSGLDADTGEPCGVCVRADVTVTFAFIKKGLLEKSAEPYAGRVVVADIGIPDICAADNWTPLKSM